MDFRPAALSDAEQYLVCWRKCAERMSYYSFANIFAYGGKYTTNLYYDAELDMYFMQGCDNGFYNMAPVGRWEDRNWRTILRTHYETDELSFEAVPEALCKIWEHELSDEADIELTERRGLWEYIYSVPALATLAGKKLLKKRNHFNRFRRDYDYKFLPIDAETKNLVESFQQEWYEKNKAYDICGLTDENRAIEKVLENWNDIPNLCGGVIEINGHVEAYTVGEIELDTVYVHFEKANVDYNGAYQAINREFAAHIASEHPEVCFINREEDLDDEGLREAKLSYAPENFNKACNIKIKFRR